MNQNLKLSAYKNISQNEANGKLLFFYANVFETAFVHLLEK